MANFFIIDHSLCKSGGHHFEYVRCIARSADEAGYVTTLGANRELRNLPEDEMNDWILPENVFPVFRQTTYQKASYLAGLQHLTRSNSGSALTTEPDSGWFRRIARTINNRVHQRRRERFVRQFALDCELFFRPLVQSQGDHALLTTVSELELMGLADYLSKHPCTIQTNWHLQFHFNLFDGRPPEYAGQKAVFRAIQACFHASLAKLSCHNIHFHATSEALADQYNRLRVGEFQVLPYPVSPEFHWIQTDDHAGTQASTDVHSNVPPSHARSNGRANSNTVTRKPLRFTCPGEFRREKGGIDYLQPLVDKIWTPHLSTGNVQIIVQRPKKKWHSRKQKIEIELPAERGLSGDSFNAVEYFSHPLSKPDYVQLIKSTDCGLLFYDSEVYYSRRAGVLGELLSNGKPVIVPAGSWLAEQIQEPIFQHVDGLLTPGAVTRTIGFSDFNWNRRNVPLPGGVLSFNQTNHPFEFSIATESDETSFVFSFDWHSPGEPGIYCRIDATQYDSEDNPVDHSSRVVGFRQSHRKSNAIFRLHPETQTIRFSLKNAFHDSMASIKNAEIECLSMGLRSDNEIPIGQVGVIANDRDHLADCVNEVVQHFEHYQSSARLFSQRWFADHSPHRTIDQLVSVDDPFQHSIQHVA